jgi:hypothetical protein
MLQVGATGIEEEEEEEEEEKKKKNCSCVCIAGHMIVSGC